MNGSGSGFQQGGQSTTGSVLPIGSTVVAADGALAQTFPMYYWIQHIRPYAPTNTSC